MAITPESKLAIRKQISELARRRRIALSKKNEVQMELNRVNSQISQLNDDIGKLQGDLA